MSIEVMMRNSCVQCVVAGYCFTCNQDVTNEENNEYRGNDEKQLCAVCGGWLLFHL